MNYNGINYKNNSSKIFIKVFMLVFASVVAYPSVFGQEKNNTLKENVGDTLKIKIMPDNRKWITSNLDVDIPGSYCFGDTAKYCQQYGRLYTWAAAKEGCRALGAGWRLPSEQEWRQLASHFGGVSDSSKEASKAAFKALQPGGHSGFNAVLGGNREPTGGYARLRAHGFYWTATETSDAFAIYYNFGAGGQMLHCQYDGEKQEAFSVRCICDLEKPGK